MGHIPCTTTSNTTAFPRAPAQAGSHTVKPRSAWPVRVPSVQSVLCCIESCTKEDRLWNELFPSSNLISWLGNFVINRCEMWVLEFTISLFFPLSSWVSLLPTPRDHPFSQIGGHEPEQLPAEPSLAVGLTPKTREPVQSRGAQ